MTHGEQRERHTHVPRLTSILDTLRTEGPGWAWRRLRYRTPQTPAGRMVHGWLRRALGVALAPGRLMRDGAGITSRDLLYAFFDLRVEHISYDAAWFVASADRERRRQGLRGVHFVIVPGQVNGLREERGSYEAAVDPDFRLWRLHNIVVGIFACLPSGAGYTMLPSREAAGALRTGARAKIYPASYEPALPVGHHPSELLEAGRAGEQGLAVLQAPVQAQRFVERWLAPRLGGRRLVTVTLRDYAFMTPRNSNLTAWTSFARRLDHQRYLPVFILDTERTLDALPAAIEDQQIFREASWSVPLRLALYERAYLNLGVNNGPLLMAALAPRPRILVFKMLTPSVPQTTAEFMRRLGFEIGAQWPFCGPFQHLVWEDDDLDVIEREFYAIQARIESSAPSTRVGPVG